PVIVAAPAPRFVRCLTTTAPLLRAAAAVPSFDPSSTTRGTTAIPSISDGIRLRTLAITRASLKAGMTTAIDLGIVIYTASFADPCNYCLRNPAPFVLGPRNLDSSPSELLAALRRIQKSINTIDKAIQGTINHSMVFAGQERKRSR